MAASGSSAGARIGHACIPGPSRWRRNRYPRQLALGVVNELLAAARIVRHALDLIEDAPLPDRRVAEVLAEGLGRAIGGDRAAAVGENLRGYATNAVGALNQPDVGPLSSIGRKVNRAECRAKGLYAAVEVHCLRERLSLRIELHLLV